MSTLILEETSGAVRRLTLNRPQARNALSLEMMRALIGALERAAEDRDCRVVVLAAAGPAFCAGHDLKELVALKSADGGGRGAHEIVFAVCRDLMLKIVTLPQPVIAEVQGLATAAGCQLVASCDLAVAARSARFATPGVNIGLFCSTPMVALSRNVGRKQAMEMLLTGDMVDAARAREMGLVNRVAADEALEEETFALARKVAEKSRTVIRMGKRAFYRQAELPLAEAYLYTSEVMIENLAKADAEEGISAFLEKRKPEWREEE
ncbi:MAG: enoyl-CoA hydratase [Alphaproteobacteria bacterium]